MCEVRRLVKNLMRHETNAERRTSLGQAYDAVNDQITEEELAASYEPQRPPPGPCNCCPRMDEYNGYGSGPTIFDCPKHCGCHD